MRNLGLAIRTLLSIVLTVIAMVSPELLGDRAAPDAPLDTNECRLSFAAISDPHIESAEYNEDLAKYTDLTLNAILPDFSRFDEKLDAFVIAGDITDHGYEEQWQKTEELLTSYDLADNIILAAGNHDTWTRAEQGKTFKDLFTEYSSRITGREIKELYYSLEVKGYTFIVLCSEGDNVSGYFSDTQINWLKAELKKAAEKDKPIFVICHWPINQTHGLPQSFGDEDYNEMTGGMGAQGDIIEKALKEYDNVFLISGHIHAQLSNAETKEQFGYQNLESYGSFHSLNLPRVNTLSPVGYHWLGVGYNIEVYDDEVVFRARNYFSGNWIPEYNYTVELV